MSQFDLNIASTKVWNGGFTMDLTLLNTGSVPLTNQFVDILGTADIAKMWGGTYTLLDTGGYRLHFDDLTIAPGETVTIGFKGLGSPDFQVAETTQIQVNPVIQPVPVDTAPTVPELVDPDPVSVLADGPNVTVGFDTSAAELEAMIKGADAGTVFKLQSGIYHFDQTITIDRSDVSLVGADSGNTVIELPSDLNQEAFAIGDGSRTGNYTLTSNISEGATKLTLSGSHNFVSGDYAYLTSESTEAFYDSIGDETWRRTDVPLRTSIVEVTSVDGNILTLANGVHFDFAISGTTVQEINMVEDVTLGGFEIDYGLGGANPSDFENVLLAYDRNAVIEVEGTSGLKLFDIVAADVPSLGVNFALSTDIAVDGLTVSGAHNKGAGGNGYAVQIRDVYDSSFVNLADMDMRHSVVFASWRSAADNMVHVTSTDRDINFHGGRDHGNTVMVDESIRDANSDIISPTLFVNTEGTHYGSVTDAGANLVRFGKVVGTRLGDNVQGYDSGSWLEGRGGDDTLTGGSGNDVLIGGEGRDTLTGGAGNDIAFYTGNHADFDITNIPGGLVEVYDRVGVQSRDTVDAEWIVFDDSALRTSDMALLEGAAADQALADAGVTLPDSREIPLVEVAPATVTETPETIPVPEITNAAQQDIAIVPVEPEPAPIAGPVIHGTDGKDTFTVTVAGSTVYGHGNWDFVRASVDFTMFDDVEKLELFGPASVNATGSDTADVILGNDARNILHGNGGNDLIWARGGDDMIFGGSGDDELHGGGGKDVLHGGGGIDVLFGGSEADTFRFTDTAYSVPGAEDTIHDFVSGTDYLDFSTIDADSTRDGRQAFAWNGTGPGALSYEDGHLLGDLNGDGTPEFALDLLGATVLEHDIMF